LRIVAILNRLAKTFRSLPQVTMRVVTQRIELSLMSKSFKSNVYDYFAKTLSGFYQAKKSKVKILPDARRVTPSTAYNEIQLLIN
jgi:hypothetical protein